MKAFFRDCVPLAERLQEISRALKHEIDSRHKSSLPEDDPNIPPIVDQVAVFANLTDHPSYFPPSFSSPLADRPQCDRGITRNFGEGLSTKTIICFQAIRPRFSFLTRYLDLIYTGEHLFDTEYHLSVICLRGKNWLEDWSTTSKLDANVNNNLSSHINIFQYLVMALLILFFPLILLKVIPWEEQQNESSVNLIMENAKNYIFEGEDENQIIDVKESGPDIPTEVRHPVSNKRDHFGCTVLKDGEMRAQTCITVRGSKRPPFEWHPSNACQIFCTAIDETDETAWHWESCLKNKTDGPGTRMEGDDKGMNGPGMEVGKPGNGQVMEVNGPGVQRKVPANETDAPTVQIKKNTSEDYAVDVDDALNDELTKIKQEYDFVALDGSTPQLFGFRSLVMGSFPPSCGHVGIALAVVRNFSVMFSLSLAPFLLMGILDIIYFKETIGKLMQFRAETNVQIKDLRFWNYVFAHDFPATVNTRVRMRWEVFYIIMACYWCLSVLAFSFPGIFSLCIQHLHPSKYFGFFHIVTYPSRHGSGLHRLKLRIIRRLGILFNKSFWKKFTAEAFGPDEVSGKRSKRKIAKGIASLCFCFLSFLPIFAVFPPFYSWNWKYWSKKVLFLIFSGISFILLGYVVIISLNIYLRFVVFTVTALIFHYKVTIGIISIVVGCLGFVISMRIQVNNSSLKDKLFILDVVKEVHGEKIAEKKEDRDRVLKYNEENGGQKILVPELFWWWEKKNWPCIPEQLNKLLELHPLGNVRVMVIVKLCVMGIFIGFVFSVMQALGMNDRNSAFDAVRVLITVLAVIGPAFIAKLQSTEAEAVSLIRKRGLVKENVEKFLKENKSFYNYDFDIMLQEEKNESFSV